MQYQLINNTVCVEGLREYLGMDKWRYLRKKGLNVIVPHGRGKSAIVQLTSIDQAIRQNIYEVLGDPKSFTGVPDRFLDTIKKDLAAFNYYSAYTSLGKMLEREVVEKYTNNASILNAITMLEAKHKQMHRFGNEHIKIAVASSRDICDLWLNTLPWSEKRLKMRHEAYKHEGYECLVHSNTGNQAARKVNNELLRLILSIKSLPQKPYDKTVVKIYKQWHNGDFELFDQKTGEIFEREAFCKGGEPIMIDESTVRMYTTDSTNAAVVDRNLMTFHSYNNNHRPHRIRDNKFYSNSLVTMDDRDLPRLDKTGRRPKAYYAYDVASGCRIGWAYSKDKNAQLYIDCMISMFQFIQQHNVGMPAEIQVENHLVKEFFPQLNKMFQFVRVCAPSNSQEKIAEHLNKQAKYSVEKENHENVGRYSLRNKANVVNTERLDDVDVEKKWDYNELVADDILDTYKYNNTPLEKFGNKTRLQMYLENQNPNLKPLEKHIAARYFGETSDKAVNIYRNEYLTVARGKYMLPSFDIMKQLPDAMAIVYWLPETDGTVSEVHLYREDRFVCTCMQVETYKTARIERTDADWDAKKKQDEYVANFDAVTKRENQKLAKIGRFVKTAADVPAPVIVQKLQPVEQTQEESLQDILDEFSPEAMKRRALMEY